jgi:hypothetical protein
MVLEITIHQLSRKKWLYVAAVTMPPQLFLVVRVKVAAR